MKNSTSLNHFLENHSVEDLGANKNIIINFWSYIDTLSLEEWLSIESKYFNTTRISDLGLIAGNITKFAQAIQFSTWLIPRVKQVGRAGREAAIYATYELIAAEKILESGRSLAVLPLFVNP
jgi:hypothetical protein